MSKIKPISLTGKTTPEAQEKKVNEPIVAISIPNDTKSQTIPTSTKAEDKKAEEVKVEVKVEDKKDAVPSIENVKADDKLSEEPKEELSEAKEETPKLSRKAKKDLPVAEKFIRDTRIEKSSNNRTIKNLFKNKDKLRFDLAIQRGEVWTHDQKSMLIHSILYGYPVPPVMVQETNDDNIWFLDGKQRLTTIVGYLNGDFAISKNTPPVFNHSIAGFKFKDLQEDMQDIIYDETIQLVKLKNMNDTERDELFVRWNSGSALSKIELTRAMHSDLIEQINHIAELEFFAENISLTTKARNRFVDQEIILQIAMLLDEGRDKMKGFGSTQVKDYVLRLKDVDQVLPKELVSKFENMSKYLNMAVHDFDMAESRKALKKIHIPIIFYTAIKAMEQNVKPALYGDFVRTFLINAYSVESDYGQSCQAGSSKKENVQIRLSEMGLAFDQFVKTLKDFSSNTIKAVEEFEKIQLETIKQQGNNKPRNAQTTSTSAEKETVKS